MQDPTQVRARVLLMKWVMVVVVVVVMMKSGHPSDHQEADGEETGADQEGVSGAFLF